MGLSDLANAMLKDIDDEIDRIQKNAHQDIELLRAKRQIVNSANKAITPELEKLLANLKSVGIEI